MIVPLRILIGFQSATDHIVTVTDGIAKVTDHFVMETLQEKRVGGGPSVYSKSESAHGGGCVCPQIILVKDKQSELHTGVR